jgi:hypothetical protein
MHMTCNTATTYSLLRAHAHDMHMRMQYDSSYQDNWHSSVLHPNYLEA